MRHVIIGAGAAGLTAAKTIRALKPDDEITVISEDTQVASRCMLHKYISGEREAEALRFVPGDFFESNRIDWIKGASVTGINTGKKEVKCGKQAVRYDKLLIATGSLSAIPPVGALRTAENVFGLRSFADAKAIREAAKEARQVVIIGGGLVGLDAAYALCELKKEVTIVDIAPRILTLNLDEKAAGAYQGLFEAAGCQFRLGTGVSGTAEDSRGNIAAILLQDGTQLPCDMVIAAAGVRPATGLVAESGIACDRSVTVNGNLATNIKGVYAAGDAAGLSGIWPNAMRQGEVAARNMCGEPVLYEDTFAIKNTVNFFGLVTLSVGALAPDEGDEVLIREDRNVYQKVILRGGCVAGVILQGDISGSGFWQYLIKNKIHIDTADRSIWKLSFADFYGLDEKGAYIWPEVV